MAIQLFFSKKSGSKREFFCYITINSGKGSALPEQNKEKQNE